MLGHSSSKISVRYLLGNSRPDVHVAGFLETRTRHKGVIYEGDYACIASPSKAGFGGVEPWINTMLPVAKSDQGKFFMRVDDFQVQYSDPRRLVVTTDAVATSCCYVVLHAYDEMYKEEVPVWWAETVQLIMDHSKDLPLVVMVDSNID